MGSDDRYSVLAHQSSDAAVTNFQTNLFQLFGHPRPAITVQAKAVLFSDSRTSLRLGSPTAQESYGNS
jgi:hypothetical protein